MPIPEQQATLYHRLDNSHSLMRAARAIALGMSLDLKQRVGAVIARNGAILGVGANGSGYHALHGCRRKELGCKTGEGYDLCEGCSPQNHAEAAALAHARSRGIDVAGAQVVMWGHWWACRDCWASLRIAGIDRISLIHDARSYFDPESPDFGSAP